MSVYDDRAARARNANRPVHVDITGTTNATPNTQTLFPHTLRDAVGAPVIPSRVQITVDGTGGTPAGFLYEMPANHTTTNVDIRATGASVKFRARLYL